MSQMPGDSENLRKRSTTDTFENHVDHDQHHCFLRVGPHHPEVVVTETPSPDPFHNFCHFTPKCFTTVQKGAHLSCTSARSTPSLLAEDGWHDGTTRTTIRVENEVEAHREANNYKFGFRKWKGHVTERPIEDRSDIVRELYSDLNTIKPKGQTGSVITCGNIVYVLLFGWWISMIYFVICPVMFATLCGAPYGKLCWKLTCYFMWPFGKSIQKCGQAIDGERKCSLRFPNCETIPEERDSDVLREESAPLLVSTPVPLQAPVPGPTTQLKRSTKYWCRLSTYVWLFLGYPLLAVVHSLAFVISWLLVFTIPVAKMNARTLTTILLMAPEEVHIQKLRTHERDTKVLLCCYHAFNWYYFKYAIQGINIFALNLLPLVLVTLVLSYTDRANHYTSMEAKFAAAITSIMPLSYFIGMGIASISAQSNFAVGAVVNATFGSITEMTFYITALLQGHHAGTKCFEEIVKSALTGTLLGCILFIPGLCMIIGGIKHREQLFNSRSAGVSSALLFISIGGVFAPTLFSKAYGSLVCESCANVPGNASRAFTCKNCHYDTSKADKHFFHTHIEPLAYTISVLLPVAYLIGLIFTLKTHAHIYDIQISDSHGRHEGHHVVHWSRWKAMAVLIMATALLAACADLTTSNIEPIMSHSSISQYFIGVTVLAMVPELPEIMNGIQFALQNNISLSLEVGSCIAVQVCMIQIPLLVLFNAFYDVGFVLVFSDIHLWASIFSVILVNYILMDGKCDYFQGTVLVVVYFILMAVYFFAPSPRSC